MGLLKRQWILGQIITDAWAMSPYVIEACLANFAGADSHTSVRVIALPALSTLTGGPGKGKSQMDDAIANAGSSGKTASASVRPKHED